MLAILQRHPCSSTHSPHEAGDCVIPGIRQGTQRLGMTGNCSIVASSHFGQSPRPEGDALPAQASAGVGYAGGPPVSLGESAEGRGGQVESLKTGQALSTASDCRGIAALFVPQLVRWIEAGYRGEKTFLTFLWEYVHIKQHLWGTSILMRQL